MYTLKKILFIILLLITQWSMGQIPTYKSLYIYNFIKRIEWPNTSGHDKFVIIVMGDEETFHALQQISLTKKAGLREIEVYDFRSLENINSIDLIYVDYSKRKHLADLVDLIGKQPILLVSDYKNSKITDINFEENDEGLEFIIRPHKIRNKGMKLSADLIQLGRKDE